ncbi:MAG TPA: family 16 glycoside hydrolase, partial [Gemmataceae bacterium]|nr:family 16 glycoside hydrolase [Gemmataceae bacterium]
MRLSRLLVAAPLFALALVTAPPPAVAVPDDTDDFLKPSNWEGREDIWTVKGGTVVGETKEDPKYNTFLCSKEKYGDFEMSFKVQLRDATGNSGVQIRSTRLDKSGDPKP